MIVVSGTYQNADGTPASGVVTFTPQYVASFDASPALIVQAPVKVRLDDTGSFSVSLLASDDPDWGSLDENGDPLPVPYEVKESISGVRRKEWIGNFLSAGPHDVAHVAPMVREALIRYRSP